MRNIEIDDDELALIIRALAIFKLSNDHYADRDNFPLPNDSNGVSSARLIMKLERTSLILD